MGPLPQRACQNPLLAPASTRFVQGLTPHVMREPNLFNSYKLVRTAVRTYERTSRTIVRASYSTSSYASRLDCNSKYVQLYVHTYAADHVPYSLRSDVVPTHKLVRL